MKKLTEKQRAWQRHRQFSSWASRLRQRGVCLVRRRREKAIRVTVDSKRGREIGWVEQRHPMPANFCFNENYNECAACIIRLANSLEVGLKQNMQSVLRHRRKHNHFASFLDFATIEKCTPSAALMIAAVYDRNRTLVPTDLNLFNLAKWKSEIVELFDQIGFFSLLGIDRPARASTDSTLTVIPFKTGDTFGNQEASQLMRTLAQMIVGADPSGIVDHSTREARMRLYAALVEACENTRKHAYIGDSEVHGRKSVTRWWMTGSYDSAEKRLSLVVYDQGITIPRSLPHWDKFGKISKGFRRLVGKPTPDPADSSMDGMMLRLAMAVPRSSTGLNHRGKGFPAFKEVINECASGRLRIVSRCGEFIFEKGRRPYARQLEVPLEGTLVEWDLWL